MELRHIMVQTVPLARSTYYHFVTIINQLHAVAPCPDSVCKDTGQQHACSLTKRYASFPRSRDQACIHVGLTSLPHKTLWM